MQCNVNRGKHGKLVRVSSLFQFSISVVSVSSSEKKKKNGPSAWPLMFFHHPFLQSLTNLRVELKWTTKKHIKIKSIL